MPLILRTAFVIFGFANVGGAIVEFLLGRAPWYVLPAGFAVGGVWSYVGYWGTIPTIRSLPPTCRCLSSSPQAHPTAHDEHVQYGLRTIQRRKRLAYWSPAVWLPVVIALLATGYEWTAFAAAIAGAILSGLFNFAWCSSECPGCGNGFYALPRTAGMLYWHTSRCRFCGLTLKAGNAVAPATMR